MSKFLTIWKPCFPPNLKQNKAPKSNYKWSKDDIPFTALVLE
jgi:hypothetical protein